MKHCLIVDDSDVIRKVARRLLEIANITSTDAEDGDQALERCRSAMPDLILVDWVMPGMAGAELIQALRALPEGDFPRIIYCTTVNDAADIAKATASGADEVLIKPFDRETFMHILRRIGIDNSHSILRHEELEGELLMA